MKEPSFCLSFSSCPHRALGQACACSSKDLHDHRERAATRCGVVASISKTSGSSIANVSTGHCIANAYGPISVLPGIAQQVHSTIASGSTGHRKLVQQSVIRDLLYPLAVQTVQLPGSVPDCTSVPDIA
eukprot:738181-Rhodomonas_salina.2